MNKSCKNLPPFLTFPVTSSEFICSCPSAFSLHFPMVFRQGKEFTFSWAVWQEPSMTPLQAVSQFSPSLIPPESPSSPLSPTLSSPIHLSVSHWTQSPWRTEITSYFSPNPLDIWLPGTKQMLNIYICEMKEWVSKSISQWISQAVNEFIYSKSIMKPQLSITFGRSGWVFFAEMCGLFWGISVSFC